MAISFTAPDSINFDTLYSVGLSTNWDTIPDERDLWAYGPKFSIRIIENVVPIEMVSFTGEVFDSKVKLIWQTASEKNNRGFEVEKSLASGGLSSERSPSDKGEGFNEWERIGFIEGNGTSSVLNNYSFIDNLSIEGKYSYRLKQIDFDGTFAYSKIISIDRRNIDSEFSLEQNYPNPFNPYTRIKYQVSRYSHITIKVYDVLGNEVATLIDEDKPAGRYEVEFSVLDGQVSSIKHIASGIYYYRFQAGEISETKKMILLR